MCIFDKYTFKVIPKYCNSAGIGQEILSLRRTGNGVSIKYCTVY